MPNDEARRNDDPIRCVDGGRAGLRDSRFVIWNSSLPRASSFVIRHSFVPTRFVHPIHE